MENWQMCGHFLNILQGLSCDRLKWNRSSAIESFEYQVEKKKDEKEDKKDLFKNFKWIER